MEIIYVILLGVAVAAFVAYPFWGKGEVTSTEDPALAGLEAARESKYGEIRDAQTDLASGKLSQADFERVDADLRLEAVDILDQIDDMKVDPAEESAADQSRQPPKSGDS